MKALSTMSSELYNLTNIIFVLLPYDNSERKDILRKPLRISASWKHASGHTRMGILYPNCNH